MSFHPQRYQHTRKTAVGSLPILEGHQSIVFMDNTEPLKKTNCCLLRRQSILQLATLDSLNFFQIFLALLVRQILSNGFLS